MLEHWLQLAQNTNASDLHLSAGNRPVVRTQGKLKFLTHEPLCPQEILKLAKEILKFKGEAYQPVNDEFDLTLSLKGLGRFRAHSFNHHRGLGLVLRFIPETLPKLSELGLPNPITTWLQKEAGLLLVTGATGSGKSTTLACMIDEINKTSAKHIITLEDPIEFLHRSNQCIIHQREIGHDVANMQLALRQALRADPDILLLGELRSADEIMFALTAAETGHLVLATLHTKGALGCLIRIIDGFSENEKNWGRSILANSLLAVISQSLINIDEHRRSAVFEVLYATSGVRNLIRENKINQIYTLMQTGAQWGMITREQSLQQKMHHLSS
ncbi:MAG: PilT/PilU family type 4a pilus ATPase [Gammaproteobacteria bacterium]|nr:PilT/PilU family type 4a pilus ATPase [Gammaproteobacteria bacterium]